PVGAVVKMGEKGRLTACPELPLALVRDLLTREQPHEVRLAGAVRTDHPDPLAEPDLGVERPDDPPDPEPAQPGRPLAGPPPLDPHPAVLHVGLVGRLLTLLEPVEPVLRRTRLRGPV